jgi:importin subunit alpha-1
MICDDGEQPALRAVGQIICFRQMAAPLVLDVQALLTNLLALLASPDRISRKEACWTLSNVTAGDVDRIQARLAMAWCSYEPPPRN